MLIDDNIRKDLTPCLENPDTLVEPTQLEEPLINIPLEEPSPKKTKDSSWLSSNNY